nr:hypothetical protein [Tanacetum cinerariifolium]
RSSLTLYLSIWRFTCWKTINEQKDEVKDEDGILYNNKNNISNPAGAGYGGGEM